VRFRHVTLATLGWLGLGLSSVSPQPPAAQPLPQIKPNPDLSVGSTLPTVTTRRGSPGPNQTTIEAKPLPRDKAPQLDYTKQTANFTIGQALVGQTSNASGVILADEDGGANGTLTLHEVQGDFQPGETISDAKGGTAVAAATQREGVWVLEFSYKPLRMRTVEIEGVGRRTVLYLYYKIVNRTGKPRMLVPQFYLITDDNKRYPDRVMPQVVDIIRAREAPEIPLLGAVSITGLIPPSLKENVDDAVYGTAIWVMDPTIAKADSLKIVVRGLSDGAQTVPGVDGKEPITKYKSLMLKFNRPGDHIDAKEREIRAADPPNDWFYDSAEETGA
jgi:hypothetical protein